MSHFKFTVPGRSVSEFISLADERIAKIIKDERPVCLNGEITDSEQEAFVREMNENRKRLGLPPVRQ